jgi:hypothetical protein
MIFSKEILIALALFYFFTEDYRIKVNIIYIFVELYNVTKSFFNQNQINYMNTLDYHEFDINDNDTENKKPPPKYEDKYLDDILKLEKDFQFSDDEITTKIHKYTEYLDVLKNEKNEELKQLFDKLTDLEERIKKCKNMSDDYCICNTYDEDYDFDETPEDLLKVLVEEEQKTLLKYNNLNNYTNTHEFKKEIQNTANELSLKYVIDQKLEKLKNCFVMEKTPLGNVIMTYNNNTSSFSYHSDNTIPYRYLETVARKFVKTFNCRPIFIVMDEELKKAEEKWETERKEKQIKEEQAKKMEENKGQTVTEKKKNVFAKFKSYNKDNVATKSMAAPPKNSIPNKPVVHNEEEKIILKDNANRYTFEGKLSNFNFLKKVDRKKVDKKYALTFADFKKMINKK